MQTGLSHEMSGAFVCPREDPEEGWISQNHTRFQQARYLDWLNIQFILN